MLHCTDPFRFRDGAWRARFHPRRRGVSRDLFSPADGRTAHAEVRPPDYECHMHAAYAGGEKKTPAGRGVRPGFANV